MQNTNNLFSKGLEKAFGNLPTMNMSIMQDAMKYKDMVENELEEKWSEKYKKSIDCKNPKGFSQKAHCQGRKKSKMKEEKLKGGLSDNKTIEDIAKKHEKKGYDTKNMISLLKKQLSKGIEVEMEHTKDRTKAREIAMDHLYEDPKYYDKLKKIENKEATSTGSSGAFSAPVGFKDSEFVRRSFAETPKPTKEEKKIEATEATSSSSVGAYSTPAFVAPNKKEWRGAAKPLYKGGAFVKVKKKCKNFPYCNQGDIKALKIYENESVRQAIKNVSEKYNVNENVIKSILQFELQNIKKSTQ
jgi:hypothetical protein